MAATMTAKTHPNSVRPERSAEGAKSKGSIRFDVTRFASYAQRERFFLTCKRLSDAK